MYLAGLELQGFKSFAKRTRLAFDRGVTCIVGPNGSGKSGIADGVRWVLGEQSLKSIRAKRSEDVIFQGSRSKARLGMAEVSLTLADAETAGLDTPELVVTRKIDRGGFSEYLVNGRPVRLFDLATLLAGAGFAQKSYTVIPQGMIDAFVTASPVERRQMFEDATGVTPLLLKVGATERKLDAVRSQTLRARDLLRELEPRLRALKRSAGRARNRAEVETSLRQAEETLAAHRFEVLTGSLRATAEKLTAAEQRVRGAAESLAALRGATAGSLSDASKLPELRSTFERLRAEERELAILLTRAEAASGGDVDRAGEEITARTKEREKLVNELGEVKSRLAEARAERSRQNTALTELHDTLQRGTAGGDSAPTLLEEVATTLSKLRPAAEQLAKKLRAAERAEPLSALAAEADRLALELASLGDRVASVPGSATDVRAAVERLRALAAERAATEETIATLHAREAGLGERVRAVEERLASLRNRRADTTAGDDISSLTEANNRLVAAQREIAALKPRVAAAEEALVRSHTERIKFQEEERRLQDLLHVAEQERSVLSVEEATTRARRDDLLREAAGRLDAAFVEKLQAGRVPPAGAVDQAVLATETERLRKKLFEIGGIDRSVLQEEAVVEKRVTELTAQVADLDSARKNLRTALRELERHIHDRFTASFRAMDEAFNRVFREVFGGGRASLSLMKPKAVEHAFADASGEVLAEAGAPADLSREVPPTGGTEWEALAKAGPFEGEGPHVHELPQGVEIHVHPPGKKLQNLAQLSGGEKALTSIALLFAILGERKSPFVVLDEVDAALDEANSRRFARLLKESARGTQFIVITHNRATMEVASALYGVTMGDDGVSQLLSIRLEEAPAGAVRGQEASLA